MRNGCLTFLLLIFSFFQPVFSQSVNLPLDHWAYTFLERMETKGIVTHLRDGSRPFTRKKVAGFVRKIDAYAKQHPGILSRVDTQMLERLKGEMWDELHYGMMTIQESEHEPHIYSWKSNQGFLHIDAVGSAGLLLRDREAETTERRIYSAYFGGILRGRLWRIGVYSDNRIHTEWGSRKYVQHYQASQGYPQNTENDSSRATWDTSDSYLITEWKKFHFQFGRDNLRWGPAKWGGLILSGLAPSFDLFKLSIDFGAVSYTWAHGALRSDFSHKWISAHRLELSLMRGIDIGFGEAVIYGNRGMELAYLNPVMPYLVAEHTLGDRDNVQWGLDFDINKIHDVKLYGEFFIDDLFAPWDIFSNYWGNKLAFTAGAFWTDCFGLRNTGFRCEYTRIEPYVYTHGDSVNVYEHYNVGMGHFLQPNSDGVFLQAEHRFSLSLSTILCYSQIRHGEGDRRLPHQEEEGEEKHFLSGIVEKKERFGFLIHWEIIRDMWLHIDAGRVRVENLHHLQGDNRSWVEIVIDLSANW